MRGDKHMALQQLNFRLPAWQKRKLVQFAEDDGKTLEGFLQDFANTILDDRIQDLEDEARILSDFVNHSNTQAKFRGLHDGGQG